MSFLTALKLATSRSSMSKLVERSILNIPTRCFSSKMTIVDVGAHSGQFIDAVCLISPKASIIAIEPNETLCNELEHTYGDRITIVRGVASNKNDYGEIVVTDDFASWSMLKPKEIMNESYGHGFTHITTNKVKSFTLDSICADIPVIDILKIDVQGYERQVLEGATDVLNRTKCIIVEVTYYNHYDGDISFWELHNVLKANRFVLYDLTKPFRLNDVSLWSDAIYVKRDDCDELLNASL